ncbi:MAG: hypothetical protein ACJAWL_001034 [Motiliproteus sp.]|jgi:hypothetical protein
MSSTKKINKKMVFVLLFLFCLAFLSVANQEDFSKLLRNFLEWKHLTISLWLYAIISFFIHYLSSKDMDSGYSGVVFKHFGVFADSAFAAITFGLASTTSSSILKGVYVQQYFGDEIYFNKFDDVDIYSMLVVCLFLLGYSFFSCSKALVSAIYLGTSEEVEPVFQE